MKTFSTPIASRRKTGSGLLLLLMALLPFFSFSQQKPRHFVVLTTLDTLVGPVEVFSATKKREAAVVVKTREGRKYYRITDVSAFRRFGVDYIMRHDLPSEYAVPYHQVVVAGKAKLYGQPCPGCSDWLALYVEFEDGEVVRVNKDNYQSRILPRLMQSPAFESASRALKMKYPSEFVTSTWLNRLSDIFTVYNQTVDTD